MCDVANRGFPKTRCLKRQHLSHVGVAIERNSRRGKKANGDNNRRSPEYRRIQDQNNNQTNLLNIYNLNNNVQIKPTTSMKY